MFKQPAGHIALADAQLLDKDLGQLQAFTGKREAAASDVIIPAANRCK